MKEKWNYYWKYYNPFELLFEGFMVFLRILLVPVLVAIIKRNKKP